MSELINIAVSELQEQHKKAKYDRKAQVMARPTLDALINFCRQSEKFAESVHDSNKTFADCMSEISKSVGNSISDIEVFRKAVSFYMPAAKIDVVMTISTSDKADTKANKSGYQICSSPKTINLNLLDLL